MSSDKGKLTSMNSSSIEIQSKKWIKPATPTPPPLHNHQLSSIDQLQPPVFVPVVFYFDIPYEIEVHEKLARLEESLSKVLTLYYPFAGRYDEDESAICCQDQGVGFVVATVDCKLHEFVNGEYDTEALVSGLEWNSPSSGVAWAPMLFIQLNTFTCGGLAIGLSFFHKLCDTFALCKFLDAWTAVCRLGTLDKLVRPSFNMSTVLPPRDFDFLKPSKSNNKPPPLKLNTIQQLPKIVAKRYVFTGVTLSTLKSTMGSYTRVELVMAIVVRSLINIERLRRTQLKSVLISQPMNFRNRTTLPIEENSCGNLCIRLMAARDLENESSELQDLAGIIRDSIRNVASEIRNIEGWSELGQMAEKTYTEFYEGSKKGEEVRMVRFSSWCRFPLYEVDFGWGTPSLVTIVPPPFLFISLMDYKSDDDDDNGGIEAWVCLNEDDQARFQHEPDILAYVSKATSS